MERIYCPFIDEQRRKPMNPNKPKSRDVEKRALDLAEKTDVSPNQAKALIRKHGDDKKEIEKEAKNFKAEG
ncbi:hypothetical protein [Mesorhizobium sp. YR577]|uniref:hypothetical protein n=1 Tax=Mesorhizobium sp. YR577 TaxID=1884373 RepID=UPI001114CF62|nr:hypothetical protein [Mesorhizobium sp. YR577]